MIDAARPSTQARTRRWRLSDRPIRTKHALLFLTPVLAILALSAVIGFGAMSAAGQAGQARQLVAVSQVAGQLAQQLQRERADAAVVFASSLAGPTIDSYEQQAEATDTTEGQFDAALSGVHIPISLQPVIERLRAELAALPLLREQVRNAGDTPASVIVFRYRAIIADLVGYRTALSQLAVDADTADGLRATATLSQAIESLGLLQVAVVPAIRDGELSPAAQQQAVAADASYIQAIETFRELAPAPWPAELSARSGGSAAATGDRLEALAVSSLPGQPLTLNVGVGKFSTAIGARMDQLHAVESDLDGSLLQDVTAQRDAEWRRLGVLGIAVLLVLIVVTVGGWWMTRSMTRPLRRLKDQAMTLSRVKLPRLVDQVSSNHPDQDATRALLDEAAQVVQVHGRDEVGAVADAFNAVSRTAVELAGQQVLLADRQVQLLADVSAAFLAVTRVLQQLLDQVTAKVDALYVNEENPDRLALLFELDERINSGYRLVGNLLVIAGDRAGPPERQPASINDIVKGAISRTDGAYQRVEDAQVARDTLIVGEAVNELVQVLTNLMHNAVRFSPPGQPVAISSGRVGDQLHIQISDQGIGISGDRLPELQQRFDQFDLAGATRQMGLYVVGRIANRLGLQVSLRPGPDGLGTRVDVIVPANLQSSDPGPNAPVIAGRPAYALAAAGPHQAAVLAIRPGTTSPAASPHRQLVPGTGPGPNTATAEFPLTAPPARASASGLPVRTPTQAYGSLNTDPDMPVAGRTPPPLDPTGPVPPGVTPEPHIYHTVMAASPFFRPGDSDTTRVLAPPAQWAAATAAATQGQRHTEAAARDRHDVTASGLPVRTPGQLVVTSGPPVAAVPRQRDPLKTNRGLSAFASSVQASRRRSHPSN